MKKILITDKSRLLFYILTLIYFSIIFLSACKHEIPINCSVSYLGDIKPIVVTKCAIYGCHADGSTLPNLNNYAVLKTWADNGIIRKNIFELKIMPPANATPLTNIEKKKIKCWLDNAAPDN